MSNTHWSAVPGEQCRECGARLPPSYIVRVIGPELERLCQACFLAPIRLTVLGAWLDDRSATLNGYRAHVDCGHDGRTLRGDCRRCMPPESDGWITVYPEL